MDEDWQWLVGQAAMDAAAASRAAADKAATHKAAADKATTEQAAVDAAVAMDAAAAATTDAAAVSKIEQWLQGQAVLLRRGSNSRSNKSSGSNRSNSRSSSSSGSNRNSSRSSSRSSRAAAAAEPKHATPDVQVPKHAAPHAYVGRIVDHFGWKRRGAAE